MTKLYVCTDDKGNAKGELVVGRVYEGAESEIDGDRYIRVCVKGSSVGGWDKSRFRLATLEDAFDPIHKLDGTVGQPGAGCATATLGVLSSAGKAALQKEALDVQIGGDHYKDYPIQPIEYSHKNKLGPCESSVVKYITRHKAKGGKQDLEKAKHFIDVLIQLEYPE